MNNDISEIEGSGEKSSRSVVSMLRDIKSGVVSASSLRIPDRRAMVEYLSYVESHFVDDIAELLKVEPRTIYRDRTAIAKADALERDPEWAKEFAGRMVKHAHICISRIRRAQRESSASPRDKIEGENRAWQIMRELCEQLRGLGYLPDASKGTKVDPSNSSGEHDSRLLFAEFDRVSLIVKTELVSKPHLNLRFTAAEMAVKSLAVHPSAGEPTS